MVLVHPRSATAAAKLRLQANLKFAPPRGRCAEDGGLPPRSHFTIPMVAMSWFAAIGATNAIIIAYASALPRKGAKEETNGKRDSLRVRRRRRRRRRLARILRRVRTRRMTSRAACSRERSDRPGFSGCSNGGASRRPGSSPATRSRPSRTQMTQVARAGHEIGIHGYSHENPIAMTPRAGDGGARQVHRADRQRSPAGGRRATWRRGGRFSPVTAELLLEQRLQVRPQPCMTTTSARSMSEWATRGRRSTTRRGRTTG